MYEEKIKLTIEFLQEIKKFLFETVYNLLIENNINFEDIKIS